MTWTPHDTSKPNVEAFLSDVRARMVRGGLPFGKACDAVFRDAQRAVGVETVRAVVLAVEDLV